MIVREVRDSEKEQFNLKAVHPLQTWEWGEFRKRTGNEVVRLGAFEGQELRAAYQLTVHRIPKSDFTVMNFLRGPLPDKIVVEALRKYGRERNSIFVKLEPNVFRGVEEKEASRFEEIENFLGENGAVPGKAQFARYTFVLDLRKTEDQLLEQMEAKTRYNVRLAQKHGVTVSEKNDESTWETYWKLTEETTKRQRFYAHNREYHETLWKTLASSGLLHLMAAEYQGQILSTWLLFLFHDTLYYPYGAWSGEHKEVMANNLMMWESIRFGKAHGATSFDMWGAAGPETPSDDPWWGFTRFKEGYGGKLVEFFGSYDLVLNPPMYSLYKLADRARWKLLRVRKKLPF